MSFLTRRLTILNIWATTDQLELFDYRHIRVFVSMVLKYMSTDRSLIPLGVDANPGATAQNTPATLRFGSVATCLF